MSSAKSSVSTHPYTPSSVKSSLHSPSLALPISSQRATSSCVLLVCPQLTPIIGRIQWNSTLNAGRGRNTRRRKRKLILDMGWFRRGVIVLTCRLGLGGIGVSANSLRIFSWGLLSLLL